MSPVWSPPLFCPGVLTGGELVSVVACSEGAKKPGQVRGRLADCRNSSDHPDRQYRHAYQPENFGRVSQSLAMPTVLVQYATNCTQCRFQGLLGRRRRRRRRRIYILSQPTRLYRCARVVHTLVKTECSSCLGNLK